MELFQDLLNASNAIGRIILSFIFFSRELHSGTSLHTLSLHNSAHYCHLQSNNHEHKQFQQNSKNYCQIQKVVNYPQQHNLTHIPIDPSLQLVSTVAVQVVPSINEKPSMHFVQVPLSVHSRQS